MQKQTNSRRDVVIHKYKNKDGYLPSLVKPRCEGEYQQQPDDDPFSDVT